MENTMAHHHTTPSSIFWRSPSCLSPPAGSDGAYGENVKRRPRLATSKPKVSSIWANQSLLPVLNLTCKKCKKETQNVQKKLEKKKEEEEEKKKKKKEAEEELLELRIYYITQH